jgi:glycosyltransferase involved in cell wall biosynthesis
LRDDVESRLRASAVAGRCVLTGLRRDIAELLAAFDLFLLSSLWEGLPRVLPQAMAAGVAVVATRTPGAAEVIVTGRSGELVEPGEPTALADRAVALLARPEQRRRYVEAGRLIAREFDERTMVSQLEEIYRRSLAAKGIQRPPA